MVEYASELDTIFGTLADPTRRDILNQIRERELSVGELVKRYDVSFAAISKHLKVLERANLIAKRKEGKKQMISLTPYVLRSADEYLEQYRQMWQSRFRKLETLLNEEEN